MNYSIVNLPAKYIIGITTKTANDGSAAQDIPALWQKFHQTNTLNNIPNKKSDEVFALYYNYEGDYTQPYWVLIGCEVDSIEKIPTGMVAQQIPASTYAVYKATGPFPQELINTWQHIWLSSLKRTYTGDFELYPAGFCPTNNAAVDVYIAIKD